MKHYNRFLTPAKIENALTYDDITLLPSYSEVASRSNISLRTKFSRNYHLQIPIVASPMDTVCEKEMAIKLASMGGVGCIHRFMTVDKQQDEVCAVKKWVMGTPTPTSIWSSVAEDVVPIMAAVGANGDFLERAKALVAAGANIILIDVAHGHHLNVKSALNVLKADLPSYVDIIAGNVATSYGAEDLEAWGADAIRVGVGGGCFTPHMKVGTVGGNKPIVDVQIGDMVYTHTGEPKEVVHKFEYVRDEEIMVINGIECTKNHEFYVVHKNHEHLVTDDNIHQYARWITAEELTHDFLLIEL